MHIEKKKIEDMLYDVILIQTKLHEYVYDGKVYGDKGFDNLPKAERVAIIGILNDATNLKNSLSNYLHWFDNTNE